MRKIKVKDTKDVWFIITFIVLIFFFLSYHFYLKKQNDSLIIGLNRLTEKVDALYLKDTTQEIIALKGDNFNLKEQLRKVRLELADVRKAGDLGQNKITTTDATTGNHGFLIKDTKPTR